MSDMIDLNQLQLHNKALTISLAAWLMEYFPESLWDSNIRLSFCSATSSAFKQFQDTLMNSTAKNYSRKDSEVVKRLAHAETIQEIVKVYTNYDVAKEILADSKIVQFVDIPSDADFLLTMEHIKNFIGIPVNQRVCQFPYEAGLIRKDLLPITVRQQCYTNGTTPKWWLPCYDLSTEFHLFSEDYSARMEQNLSNRWIIKPAQGTRGIGHQIISGQDKESLRLAAAYAPQLSNNLLYAVAGCADGENSDRILPETLHFDGIDRVAQLLVDRPLLVQGRKFDIRTFVFVRSFEPFEVYTHSLYYARLANKAYDVHSLADKEVSITVSAYDDDVSIAEQQARLLNVDLKAALEKENPGLQYDDMVAEMRNMLRELFQGAAPTIGQWPQSSAYYSVDVIFDTADTTTDIVATAATTATATATTTAVSDTATKSTNNTLRTDDVSSEKKFTPTPKLIEVNFLGDWHGVEAAVKEKVDYFDWAEDLICVLATRKDVSDNERLIRL